MTDPPQDDDDPASAGPTPALGRDAVLSLRPIGLVRSPFVDKRSAPRQPDPQAATRGRIELFSETGFQDALLDLDRWSHIWVLFWFHLSTGWKPRVFPPRSAEHRGVFATRAPHRPNPIGMSVLRLERVEGMNLHVSDLDLLDGTPVLDIKPYVPYADARLEAGNGWLEQALAPPDPGPRFEVRFAARAQEQLEWLAGRTAFDLRAVARQSLELGPTRHAYRRIRPDGEYLRIGIKDFRLRFLVREQVIEVVEIATGYRSAVLRSQSAQPSESTPLDVHRAFVAKFGPRAAK